MTTAPRHEVRQVEPGYLMEFNPCPRCEGKGYHHGFGEHGWDPDWCSKCGGDGFETKDLLTGYDT